MKKQSTAYKNFLSLLVRYNMIENKDKFEGNSPIKWWEYLDMYVRWVFNYDTDTKSCNKTDYTCKFSNYKVKINSVDVSLDSVFKDMWINDYNSYINKNKVNSYWYIKDETVNKLMSFYSEQNYYATEKTNFDSILIYKLAWVNEIWEFTPENIANFEKNKDEENYVASKKKVEDFLNSIYGTKKILISDFYRNYDTMLFTQKSLVYFPEKNNLILVNKLDNEKVSFSSLESKKEKEFDDLVKAYKCSEKNSYVDFISCNKAYKAKYSELKAKYSEINENDWYYFYPLSRAEAIKQIFNQVDFWLFDKDLAKKKDTEIEDNAIPEAEAPTDGE